MRKTNKYSGQNSDSNFKKLSALSFDFCPGILLFSYLLLCSFTPSADAQLSSEQFDPIVILLEYNSPTPEDINSLNTPLQADNAKQITKEKIQLSDNSAVNFAAQVDENIAKNSLIIVNTPNSETEKKLWQSRISHIEDEKESKIKNELQHIIEKIRTIEFEEQQETAEPVIEEKPLPQKIEVKETLPDTQFFEENIRARQSYEIISDETLKIFEELSEKPELIENPFELAEILFQSGHLKQAAKCYMQALEQKKTDEFDSDQRNLWTLLQIGNCTRRDNPRTAVKMYEQLISEYPDSIWADMAKAQTKLVNWYIKEKPENLITENKSIAKRKGYALK